jgi:hypothetical protein
MKRIEHLIDGFFGVLLDRDTRAEGARTSPGLKQDCHHVAPARALVNSIVNLAHHRNIENVERRSRELDSPDALFNIEFDTLVLASHKKIRDR